MKIVNKGTKHSMPILGLVILFLLTSAPGDQNQLPEQSQITNRGSESLSRIARMPISTSGPERHESFARNSKPTEAGNYAAPARAEMREKDNKVALAEVPEEKALYRIEDVKVSELPDWTEVTVVSDKPLRYSSFALSEPPRVVLDFPEACLEWEKGKLAVEKGALSKIRSSTS